MIQQSQSLTNKEIYFTTATKPQHDDSSISRIWRPFRTRYSSNHLKSEFLYFDSTVIKYGSKLQTVKFSFSHRLVPSENESLSQPMLSTICDAATGVKERSEFILDELFGHTILDIDIRIRRKLCEWWRANHVKYNHMLFSNINLDTVMSICGSGNTTTRSSTTICSGILRENMIRKIEKKCN